MEDMIPVWFDTPPVLFQSSKVLKGIIQIKTVAFLFILFSVYIVSYVLETTDMRNETT